MEILIYCEAFWPNVGGMESSIECLARYLHDHGAGVHVVTETAYDGENPFPFPVHWQADRRMIRRFLAETDVLHLNVLNLGLRLRALATGKKVVTTFADVTPICPKGLKLRWDGPCDSSGPFVCLKCMKRSGTRKRFKFLFRPLVKSLVSVLSHANIVISPWTLDRYPLVRKRLVPRYIDANQFSPVATAPSDAPTDGKTRVVYAGRLVVEKGVQVLLEALRICADRGRPFQLIICGDGDHRPTLERQVEVAGLKAHVDFRGVLDKQRLVQALHEADIAVVPSLCYETFGRAAAEAMAAGLPVVVTDAGGTEDVVADIGIVVGRGASEELAEAIGRLMENEELRQSLGRAGRARVFAQYGEGQALRRQAEVYEAITGRPIDADARSRPTRPRG